MTIWWNEVTIWWNEVTKGWNEVVWNEVVMERSDRIPLSEVFKLFRDLNSIKMVRDGKSEANFVNGCIILGY